MKGEMPKYYFHVINHKFSLSAPTLDEVGLSGKIQFNAIQPNMSYYTQNIANKCHNHIIKEQHNREDHLINSNPWSGMINHE
jgi:hypothetical protein